MADYSIELGVKVNTKNIDTAINKYQGKPIEIKSKLDTSGIDNKIANYKVKKPIEINAKLNTSGLAKKIGEYKPKTPVKLNAKLDTKNISAAIKGYKAPPIKVDIKLDNSNISKQIKAYKASAPIKVDVKLDSNDITKQIRAYQTKTPIKLGVKLTTKDIDEKIRAYKAKTPIKLDVKINKSVINEQIKSFNPKNTIKLKASLQKGIIAEEIRKYKPNTPIKVDLELDYSDIDKKVGEYAAKGGVPLPAKLVPVSKGFDSNITKKPIEVGATLDASDINKVIDNFKATSKIKVDVKLDPKDIGAQVQKLPKPTEPINVDVDLNETSINSAIALFQPTATLGIKPDLILEDVDDQIRAYVPQAKVKVNVDLDDNDINAEMGKQKSQTPIQVNVKLDREKLNEQIRNFKTQTKIKVGIKLDSKGIAEQIRKIEPKTKIKVGVELDKNDVAQQIQNLKIDSPVKLGVELDEDNVLTQIDNIKKKLQKLGNIRIEFGSSIGIQDEKTKDIDGIVSNGSNISNIVQEFKEADIKIKATEDQIKNLGIALKNIGFNNSSVESITNEFKELGITVTKVTSRLNGDGSVNIAVKGLDQFKNAVTYINSIDANGQLGNWSETISKDINNVAENFNRLKSIAQEIGSIKIDIFKSDDANEVKSLTVQLNKLQTEYNEIFASTQGGLTSNQIGQLDSIAKKSEIALSNLKKEYAETRAELAKEIKGNFSGYDAQVKSLETSIQKLSSVTPEVTTGIGQVKQALKDMKNAANNDELIAAEDRYQNELKETLSQLKINQAAEEQGYYGDSFATKKEAAMIRLNGLFEDGSQAAKKFGVEARNLYEELNHVGNVKGIDNVNRKISALEKKIKSSNLQTKTWSTRLKEQFSRYSNYLSIASVFMYATQAARSMFEQVKLIDSAMTELKKVTNETDASYNQFLSNAATKAKEIGTTIDGLVSSTADFARLGYNFADSQGLAEVANIYAVVGDDIDSVEDATQSLISTLAAFKDEIGDMGNDEFALSIVDKMNEVANNYAISSGGLGEALQRSASSMAAANNTLDETIAMITAANEVAQNPDKVGNAMKTKFLYNCLSA